MRLALATAQNTPVTLRRPALGLKTRPSGLQRAAMAGLPETTDANFDLKGWLSTLDLRPSTIFPEVAHA